MNEWSSVVSELAEQWVQNKSGGFNYTRVDSVGSPVIHYGEYLLFFL